MRVRITIEGAPSGSNRCVFVGSTVEVDDTTPLFSLTLVPVFGDLVVHQGMHCRSIFDVRSERTPTLSLV